MPRSSSRARAWRRVASIHLLLVAVLGAIAILPIACAPSSATDSSDSTGSHASTGNATNSGGAGGGCTGFCGQGGNNGMLTIVPPTATIVVDNGVASPVTLTAEENGQPVSASTWQVDLSAVAGVDGTGIVTASGNLGGHVIVTAKLNGQIATATVDVTLKRTINLSNVTQAKIDLLNAASTPDGSIVWAYPYNTTVFPKGLLAPKMMWNGGNAGDLYRIHLTGNFIDFAFYTTVDPPSRFLMDDPSWTELTESGPGGKVNVEVDRLVPNQAAATKVIGHQWTIANGSMKGTVYYWANSLGRVLRIKPGASAPDDFLAAAGVTDQCSTCHAVSANGSTLVIGGDTNVASTFDLLTGLPVFTTNTVGKPVRNWAMPAVSPDGNVLIENNGPLPGPPGGSDGLWDTHSGQHLTGLGLDGVFLDMPAFAPNGTKIAYVDHNDKSLGVRDYDAASHVVSNPIKLVDQGSSPIAFPSVSPDAKSVIYHRGSLDTRYGKGDLYIASITQPGSETRLSAIDGDGYPFAAGARDLQYNYEPTFAPVNSGGYAWVVFTSRRTWGNELTGCAQNGDFSTGCVKQLWVAAIDQTVTPNVDPSHPAFRLSGQDEATLNMRGFWALDPCKQAGASCSNGSECCDMNCDMGICKDPNPNGCSGDGSSCMTAADCCDALAECINSVCSAPPPQ
jgi:hypothetical protein